MGVKFELEVEFWVVLGDGVLFVGLFLESRKIPSANVFHV